MPDTTFLYELKDPRTGETRYVGKSDDPFDRFKKHLSQKKRAPVSCWVRSLLAQGLTPHMDLLDEVPVTQWEFWEREYIRVYRAVGVRLLNLAEGGEGKTKGSKLSEETRKKISSGLRGKKFSAEHRQKIISSRRKNSGPWHSPETIEKMRAAQSGRKLSEEHKKKISASLMGNQRNLGRKASPESRAKMSQAHRAKERI